MKKSPCMIYRYVIATFGLFFVFMFELHLQYIFIHKDSSWICTNDALAKITLQLSISTNSSAFSSFPHSPQYWIKTIICLISSVVSFQRNYSYVWCGVESTQDIFTLDYTSTNMHTSYLSFLLHNHNLRCGNFTLKSA